MGGLLQEFADLKEIVEADDYIRRFPHCIFEMILLLYVRELCENSQEGLLVRIGNFIEGIQ